MIVNDVLTQVKNNLDIVNKEAYGDRSIDPMISETELYQKMNDSLEEIQGIINAHYEDYFLTYTAIPLQTGVSEYDLPSDIYLNKLRRVYCQNGASGRTAPVPRYKVNRLDNIDDYQYMFYQTGQPYRYMLFDDNSSGDYVTKIGITPIPVTTGEYICMWYIRQISTKSASGQTIDIPFTRYLVKDTEYKCLDKDVGNPMIDKISKDRDELKTLMEESISNKVPDDRSGMVRMDMSFYEESY